MQDAKQAVIDYPQEDEKVTSSNYTFRIGAPRNAKKVEVSVNDSAWRPCRFSAGYWWYDWSQYGSGEHEVVARIHEQDSHQPIVRSRQFQVELEQNGRRDHSRN